MGSCPHRSPARLLGPTTWTGPHHPASRVGPPFRRTCQLTEGSSSRRSTERRRCTWGVSDSLWRRACRTWTWQPPVQQRRRCAHRTAPSRRSSREGLSWGCAMPSLKKPRQRRRSGRLRPQGRPLRRRRPQGRPLAGRLLSQQLGPPSRKACARFPTGRPLSAQHPGAQHPAAQYPRAQHPAGLPRRSRRQCPSSLHSRTGCTARCCRQAAAATPGMALRALAHLQPPLTASLELHVRLAVVVTCSWAGHQARSMAYLLAAARCRSRRLVRRRMSNPSGQWAMCQHMHQLRPLAWAQQ